MRIPQVLIVDDEPVNRTLLQELLKPFGYATREAGDGEEALASVAEQPPDLILLDAVMPRRDGYSVCQALKLDPKTRLIPIIMLTALDKLPDKLKAVDLGIDDFLAKPFHIAELTTRVRSLLSLKQYTDDMEHAVQVMEGMALTVERRDAYTGNHGKRIGAYAVRVGRALQLPEEDLDVMRLGGIFHDLGKIAVPDAVLHKPGRLDPGEMESMMAHTVVGAEICAPMRTLERAIPLIRSHHERLDGSGYPDGLSGSRIPLPVRIISVVDIYDALATRRPYKDPIPRGKCLAILREEADKGWWDRDIVDTFAKVTSADDS